MPEFETRNLPFAYASKPRSSDTEAKKNTSLLPPKHASTMQPPDIFGCKPTLRRNSTPQAVQIKKLLTTLRLRRGKLAGGAEDAVAALKFLQRWECPRQR